MLLCLSASHKTASFDLLERLSVHTGSVARSIAEHSECVQGAVVVATCNRFEAYVDMDEPVTAASALGVEAALLAVEAATGVAAHELDGAYELYTGDGVAEHLFSVASGLESVVVGEGEIAGQVRRALADAHRDGTTSTELERLFQRASETQREVKNGTAIGRAGRSLVRLGLELADSRIADWSALDVLLVGTGAYAAATLAALRDQGAERITVFSPSGRAERFALKHGIAHTSDLAVRARRADLVITCTSAEGYVVTPAVLGAEVVDATAPACPVAHERTTRRMVIDLGLPRNVDPAVAQLADTDLLDLETIRLHAPLEELQATDTARALVQDAARRFTVAGERRSVTPAVVALRAHVFELLEAEIARARARGDDGRAEQSLRHLVGVLLHTPTIRAHELADAGHADDYVAGLEALFGIVPAAEATAIDDEAKLA